MKKILLLILVLSANRAIGQGYNHTSLDCNGVRMMTGNTGGLIDALEYEGGMEKVPEDEESPYTRSIMSTYISVAGKINGKISGIFVNKYSPLNNFQEYQNLPGPHETKNRYYPEYDKFWRVKKWEIQALKDDYKDNGKLDSEPSVNILTWPARGNKYSKAINNVNWPGRNLAPFFDRNYDGNYDPYDGDFPVIDRNCPDNIPSEMIWSIFHSVNFGLEMQVLSYGFESEINPVLNKTIFTKVRFLNAGPILVDPRFGLYFDFDLGCNSDDCIGTSPAKSAVYAYNKFEFEPTECSDTDIEIQKFSGSTPTQSITCLNRKATGSIIYDRGNIAASNDPTSPEKFYNYLNNKWNNGQNLTFGGNGYLASNRETDYIFPSSPADPNGWSMMTSGLEMEDPKGFLNFAFPNMPYNKEEVFDFAMTLHEPDMSVEHLNRVDKMIENIDVVKNFYNNCYKSPDIDLLCQQNCVWPGDADNNGIVNNLDILPIGTSINMQGIKRDKMTRAWAPYPSENWDISTSRESDYKYLDCNGNGEINRLDFSIVEENMLSKNATYSNWGGFNTPGNLLTFDVSTDSLVTGSSLTAKMILGKSESVDLFGLGFTVEYDSTLMDLINFSLEKKWLDKKNEPQYIYKTENGKIHFALVRKTKGSDLTVSNINLGTLKFKVKENIGSSVNTSLLYSNFAKISSTGTLSELTSSPAHLYLIGNDDVLNPNAPEDLILYPNPANEMVTIKSRKKITYVELIDVLGFVNVIHMSDQSFRVGDYKPGCYSVKLTDDRGNQDFARLVIVK